MLEQITEWFANGGTYLTVGVTTLVSSIPIIKSIVTTFKDLKSALPEKVQSAVDERMLDVEAKIEGVKTSSDKYKLEETIINCKAKLESTVLSPQLKQEYFDLMNKAQTELKEVYGIVKEIPANVETV